MGELESASALSQNTRAQSPIENMRALERVEQVALLGPGTCGQRQVSEHQSAGPLTAQAAVRANEEKVREMGPEGQTSPLPQRQFSLIGPLS